MLKLILINLAIFFMIALHGCGTETATTKTEIQTVIQTRYSTTIIPFLRYTTIYVPTTPTTPVVPPAKTIVSDPTNTIGLIQISATENFRTATNVNFSTAFKFQNLSSSRINFGWTVNGLTSADLVVFSRTSNSALDGKQTTTDNVSWGEPLTISAYDSITKWNVTGIHRY